MSICSVFKHLRILRISHTHSRAFSRTTWLYSYYKTLDVPQNATQKQIKEAYFTLSKKYHPDLHPNDPKCHEKFIKLQEAYKVLSNPKTREEYDSASSNRSAGYSSQGSYASQAQSQYYNQRAWSRPDFSKRDEWIRYDRMKREQREKEFQQNFSERREFNDFNRFYSKPHNLTPEEMEFLLQQRKFSKNNKVGLIILGIFFVVMFIESMISMHRYGTFERMYDNSRRYSHPGVGFRAPGLVPEDQFKNNQNSFEDYLRRRDLRQNDRSKIYDDTDMSE